MNMKFFGSSNNLKAGHVPSLDKLRANASDIVSASREALAAYQSPEDQERTARALGACADEVAATEVRVHAGLDQLGKRRISAGHHFRVMQTTYQTLRKPNKPDALKTMQLVLGFGVLEACLSGGVMVADGKVDLPTGMAFGAILALITTLLGLVTGFLALRYLNYREPYNIFEAEG